MELALLDDNNSNVKDELDSLHKKYLNFLEELPLESLNIKEDLELFTKQVYNRLGYKVENSEYKKTLINEIPEVKDAIESKTLEVLVSQNIGFFQMIDGAVNLKPASRVVQERNKVKEELVLKEEIKEKTKEKIEVKKEEDLEKVIKISERIIPEKITKEKSPVIDLPKPEPIELEDVPSFEEPIFEAPLLEEVEAPSKSFFESATPVFNTEEEREVNLDNTISLDPVSLDGEEVSNDDDTFEMEMYENFSLEEVSSVMYGDSKYWKEIYKANLNMLNNRVEERRAGDYTDIEKDSNVFTGLILKVPTSVEK